MGKLTLKQAAAWCGGWVDPKYENVEFFGANNDTRLIQKGQLFIVLQGARDGHDFISAAMEKGAAAVLCSRIVGDYPAIVVEDPRIALGDIARQECRRIGCKVVGITGSVGKSTTKEMIASVLEGSYRVAKTPVNHNNDIGMPMAILAMAEDTQVAVLEMGMNHFREMAYLSSIAQPDIGVIINIGTMHIEHLGSVEGIRQAKLEILEGMAPQSCLILNGDDRMLRNLPVTPVQPVTYFGSDEGCAVQALNIRDEEGILSFRVTGGNMDFQVEMGLEGLHFVPDALAAVTVASMLGVSSDEIRQRLFGFRNLSGRQEIFESKGCAIIRDCYNAGPESMAAALAVLGKRSGRRIAVLGDMLELGHRAPEEHYKVGQLAAVSADLLLAYGPNAGEVIKGAVEAGMDPSAAAVYTDHRDMGLALKKICKSGDALLFKGSRGMHMEYALDHFLKEEK